MTQQDDGERAWREYEVANFRGISYGRGMFHAGWDAAKREDETHIAALVAALRQIVALGETDGPERISDPYERADAMWEVAELTLADDSERALAGQTEEATK